MNFMNMGRMNHNSVGLKVFLAKQLYFLLLIICTCLSNTQAKSVPKAQTGSIKCKTEDGKDVDWFIAYKLPRLRSSPDPYISRGLGLAYILPGSQDWQISTGKGINDSTSLIGLTLSPLYQKDTTSPSSNFVYILYNDQPPSAPTINNNAHAKGILLANAEGGIWIQHSVPHYPELFDEKGSVKPYNYPTTGESNGQVLQCLSLNAVQMDNVGNILEIIRPHVYNYTLSEEMAKIYPTLANVVREKKRSRKKKAKAETNLVTVEGNFHHDVSDCYYHYAIANTVESEADHKIVDVQNAGRTLQSFAKGPSYNQEIYSDWIAPYWKSDLDVQSWLNGPNAYPSNCTVPTLSVYNIDDKTIAGNTWTTSKDHAKWAISNEESRPVVCIGDLNRMEHQTKRGGSVNCFTDKNVWTVFKKSVVSTQPCQKPKPH